MHTHALCSTTTVPDLIHPIQPDYSMSSKNSGKTFINSTTIGDNTLIKTGIFKNISNRKSGIFLTIHFMGRWLF